MNWKQVIGLVALALGVVILIYACNEAETYREQAAKLALGRYTKNTLWAYGLGIALSVVGLGVAVFFRKRKK